MKQHKILNGNEEEAFHMHKKCPREAEESSFSCSNDY